MHNLVQVKAAIPRPLKRRAFAAFALREEKFNRWLRTQLEGWLQEIEEPQSEHHDERLVGSQAHECVPQHDAALVAWEPSP